MILILRHTINQQVRRFTTNCEDSLGSFQTGGTISGCAKYLKEKNTAIEIIGFDAYGSVLKIS